MRHTSISDLTCSIRESRRGLSNVLPWAMHGDAVGGSEEPLEISELDFQRLQLPLLYLWLAVSWLSCTSRCAFIVDARYYWSTRQQLDILRVAVVVERIQFQGFCTSLILGFPLHHYGIYLFPLAVGKANVLCRECVGEIALLKMRNIRRGHQVK